MPVLLVLCAVALVVVTLGARVGTRVGEGVRNGVGDVSPDGDVEVVVPSPGAAPDVAPDVAPADPSDLRSEARPAAAAQVRDELTVSCLVEPDCERSRVATSTGLPLAVAVLDGLLAISDGMELTAMGPEGPLWTTTLTDGAEDPYAWRPTSLVTTGDELVATALDGRLVRVAGDGSLVTSREDPGPELQLVDARLEAAAATPGRLLLAMTSRLSPSLGQAGFAEQARTAAIVVAVDPDTLEVLERSDRTPQAQLIDGVPLLYGRPVGEIALDPRDLDRVLWRAETRRPGIGPSGLLDRVLTIDDQALDLRDATTGTTTLRLPGTSWSIQEETDGAVVVGTDPDGTGQRAYGLGAGARLEWQLTLPTPCCARLVPGVEHGTVRLIAEDGSSIVVDTVTGTVRAREPAGDEARTVTARDGLEVVESADGLEVRAPDGTHLATVGGDAVVIDLPSSFARRDHSTIAFRDAGAVVELAFPR